MAAAKDTPETPAVVKGPTEAGAIADLALRAERTPMIVKGEGGHHFLVTPLDMGVQGFNPDPHDMIVTPPVRVRQAVVVQTQDSLVDYVNRFKSEDTVLFADIAASAILALIDYHHPGGGEGAFVDHSASLQLPFSEEWKIWTGANAKLVGQLEFARFLEENAVDVTAPSGAELLEVCRDLQAHRKVNFIKAVRTASDNENFEYSDETTATSKRGGIEIPTQFRLDLPVYFGEPNSGLMAYLRWRLDEGAGLSLGYQLSRAEHVRQAVFKQIVIAVGERVRLPVVFGRAK
jgi:uncharacterized protein YfdQ (DUF2303 family)